MWNFLDFNFNVVNYVYFILYLIDGGLCLEKFFDRFYFVFLKYKDVFSIKLGEKFEYLLIFVFNDIK